MQRYDGVLERTLAVTLLQQGRLAEAEFHRPARAAHDPGAVGRDSVDVGQGLAVLSNILGEQGAMARRRALPRHRCAPTSKPALPSSPLNLARARQFMGRR